MLSQLIKIVKSGSILSFGKVFQGTLQFLLLPVYTRLLSPEDFGVIDMITIFHSILTLFILVGVRQGFTRSYLLKNKGISLVDHKKNKLDIISTAIFFILMWGLIILLFLIPQSKEISFLLFKTSDFSNLIILSLFISYGNALSQIYEAYFLNDNKVKTYVFITSFQLLINLSFIIFMILHLKRGVEGIIIANALTNISFGTILCFWMLFQTNFSFKLNWLKSMLRFGAPAMIGILILFLFDIIDRLFIQYYFDMASLGKYSIARKISKIQTMAFVAPFLSLWSPLLFKIANEKNHKEIFGNILPLILALFSFFTLALSLFAEELLWLFATKEYYSVYNLVIWICMAQTVFVGSSIMTAGMSISGKSEIGTFANFLVVIFGLVLNLLLVPKYGMIGASIATFFTFLIQFGLFYMFFQKLYFIPYKMIASIIIMSLTFIFYFLVVYLIKNIKVYFIVSIIKVLALVSFIYILYIFIGKNISIKYLLEKFKIDF